MATTGVKRPRQGKAGAGPPFALPCSCHGKAGPPAPSHRAAAALDQAAFGRRHAACPDRRDRATTLRSALPIPAQGVSEAQPGDPAAPGPDRRTSAWGSRRRCPGAWPVATSTPVSKWPALRPVEVLLLQGRQGVRGQGGGADADLGVRFQLDWSQQVFHCRRHQAKQPDLLGALQ